MTRDDFTEVEWRSLLQGAAYAALAVVLTDKTDPVVFLRKIQAAARVLTCELWQCKPRSSLVRSLIASLEETDILETLWEDDLLFAKSCEMLDCLNLQNSAQEARSALLGNCSHIARILASKVPAVQAHDYRMWLLSLARDVAVTVQSDRPISASSFEMLRALELALREESCSARQLTQLDS